MDSKQINELIDSLKNVEGMEDSLAQFGALMELQDEQFKLIYPVMLAKIEEELKDPNACLMFVQALNLNGATADEVKETIKPIQDGIEQLELSEVKKDYLKQLLAVLLNAIARTEGIDKRTIQIPIECGDNVRIPEYAHLSDSGMDLFALDDYTIMPGETMLIPTGIKVAIPDGYEIQIRPKSGRCLKTKLRVANSPATIDSAFKGEICVIIENVEPPIRDIHFHYDDNQNPVIDAIDKGVPYYIGKGEKFAQIVLAQVPKISFYRVDSVAEIGEDRHGGFGSTDLT